MEENRHKNSTIQRRRLILQQLEENGEVYVPELSKTFRVSEVTIRNDLLQLEHKNMLLRGRGGAIRLEANSELERQMSEKAKLHFQQKTRISRAAARLVHSHDTILIGPGTTTNELARNLPGDVKLTVITNSITIILHLMSRPDIKIIVLGGYLRKNTGILVGPIAEMGLKNFYVDKVFLGADGCDTNTGIYTGDLEVAQLNQLMISNSREVILLTDSSKFLRKSLTLMCSMDRIDTVVTDDGILAEDRRRLEDHGMRVIIA